MRKRSGREPQRRKGKQERKETKDEGPNSPPKWYLERKGNTLLFHIIKKTKQNKTLVVGEFL